MKLIGRAIAIASMAGAITIVACSTRESSTGGGAGNGGNSNIGSNGNSGVDSVGQVKAALDLAPGIQLQSLDWTISNGTNTYTGVVNIGDAQSVEWVAGGILAGMGYTVSATGTAGIAQCSGKSGAFTVNAGQLTAVAMAVTCVTPPDASVATDTGTGSVFVDAGVFLEGSAPVVCPGITSFAASPAEVVVGQTSALSVTPTNSSNAVVTWTSGSGGAFFAADGGNLGTTTTGLNASFECTQPNITVSVTATVDLVGDDAGLCKGQQFTSMTVPINCESGTASCSAQNPNTPNSCTGTDGGTVCVNFSNDPHNCGSCGNNCGGPATSCINGLCACPTSGQSVCTPGDGGASFCTNLQNDVNNCGSCGNVCPSGDVCTSGSCGANPPTACQTNPCAASGPNSIKCTGNATGGTVGGVQIGPNGCTPTEAAIINARDANNSAHLTGGQLNSNSCYSCMEGIGCLDDQAFAADISHECGDVSTAAVDGENGVQACLDTINCALQAKCITGNPPNACFCGTASTSTCFVTAGAANGTCENQEINGLPFHLDGGTNPSCTANPDGGTPSCTPGDLNQTNNSYPNVALPAGMANTLMGCAFTNCASQCTP